MSEEASGQAKSRASFGDVDGAERWWARKRRLDGEQETRRLCMTLVGVSVVLLLVAAETGATGSFVQTIHTSNWATDSYRYWGDVSLSRVIEDDWGWRSALLTAAATPIWFVVWCTNRMAWGRALGAAWSFSGAVVVLGLAIRTADVNHLWGSFWFVVASECCVGWAFVKARLRDPETLDAVQVRALIRRHRKTA